MPHTYSRILIHLIFSTKNRAPVIERSFREKLFAYIAGIIRQSGGEAIAVNGAADHVHAFLILPMTRSISEMVRLIKSNSSKWVHDTHRKPAFGWQRGYAAFSVSQSNLGRVGGYVDGQEEHHRKIPFQDEYLGFLRKHGIAFDAGFVWD